jgi:hypothetical protein
MKTTYQLTRGERLMFTCCYPAIALVTSGQGWLTLALGTLLGRPLDILGGGALGWFGWKTFRYMVRCNTEMRLLRVASRPGHAGEWID